MTVIFFKNEEEATNEFEKIHMFLKKETGQEAPLG